MPRLRTIFNLNIAFHTPSRCPSCCSAGIRKPIGLTMGRRVVPAALSGLDRGCRLFVAGSGTGSGIYSSNCGGMSCGAKSKVLYSLL